MTATGKKKNAGTRRGPSSVTENRKARYEYHIFETYEAGMVLLGTEVKSLRDGRMTLKDSYARVVNDEVFLFNAHISEYTPGRLNHDPERVRKLLLHRSEIRKLRVKVAEKGLTLVPLRVYFKRKVAKVEIAVCRGKQQYDKRDVIRDREARREMERYKKGANRSRQS